MLHVPSRTNVQLLWDNEDAHIPIRCLVKMKRLGSLMMNIYRWVKGDKVPEKIRHLINISHEGGYNGSHFKLSIRACVLYIENNSLVCLGIGKQYGRTVERNDIWNFDANKDRRLFIDHLWTHPEHRGKGYGTIMLKALESELNSYEQSTIYIVGIHSAGSFYVKNGYLPIEIVTDEEHQEQLLDACEFESNVALLYANKLEGEKIKLLYWYAIITIRFRPQYHTLVTDPKIPLEMLIDVFEKGIMHENVIAALAPDAYGNTIEVEDLVCLSEKFKLVN